MISLIFQNHYQRLQIDRSATGDDIRKAFRRLALIHHPDLAEDKERAHKIFLLIKEAHTTLADPQKRQDYDEWLDASTRFKKRHPSAHRPAAHAAGKQATPSSQPPPAAASQSNHTARPRRPAAAAAPKRPHRFDLDRYATLEIPLEDALLGATHTVTVAVTESATASHDLATFPVVIPPMCHAGRELTIKGRGLLDKLTGERGNLILTIDHARHEIFRPLAYDLYAMVDVWPWDAALGSFMRVPTLEGYASLKIPAGAQPWQKFILNGQGLPTADSSRGDLYITLRFVFPKEVGSREAALWRQLKTAYAVHPSATGKP